MGKFTPEQELEICEIYEQVERGRIVAEAYGVSTETIYRVLRRHGVRRTHRHQKSRKPRKLWDNALTPKAASMYESGKNCKEIASELSYSATTIYKRLKAAGVIEDAAHRLDNDQTAAICDLYESGLSNREIAERFGITPQTVSKVAKRNGCEMRGRKANGAKGGAAYAKKMRSRARERFETIADSYELAEFVDRDNATVRCKRCGTEFRWTRYTWDAGEPCPGCRAEQAAQRHEAWLQREDERRQQREAAREWRLSVPQICKECGEPFYAEREQSYCCNACRKRADNRRKKPNRAHHGNQYKRRMRVKVTRLTYDRTVTLDAVYKKYRGRCCECGCKTERTRGYSPRMATLDHIVALGNYGTHTWDNVQLLCSDCNSRKRDLGQMRLPMAI